MIRTMLITGTRAPATLDLARRLWREGVRVIGADSMRFPLGRFSRAYAAHYRVPPPRQDRAGFLAAIQEIARRESVDLIWPTCEEVFHLAAGRKALSSICQVLCPSPDVLEQLHHKLRFAKGVGKSHAPASWDGESAPTGERLIWKPNYSRFAARTRLDRPAEVRGWMAQRFIPGRELSSWALCVEGEIRVLTQYRCPVRVGLGAGCAFEPAWSREILDFTAKVAGQLRYTGGLAFDFMESSEDDKTYVLECNPRLTSGLHLLDPSIRLTDLLAGKAAPAPPPQHGAELFLLMLHAAPRLAGNSPDVVYSPDDRNPVWGQAVAVAECMGRQIRHRVSLLEASTWDIEYNGE